MRDSQSPADAHDAALRLGATDKEEGIGKLVLCSYESPTKVLRKSYESPTKVLQALQGLYKLCIRHLYKAVYNLYKYYIQVLYRAYKSL